MPRLLTTERAITFLSGIALAVIAFQTPWWSLLYSWRNRRYVNAPSRTNKVKTTSDREVPENAPSDCPGLESQDAGKSSACVGCPNQEICESGAVHEPDPAFIEIFKNMSKIKKKIVILSGKGGVGKSTISSQLSKQTIFHFTMTDPGWLLQERGFDIGLLDVDVCGPSIPMMTGSKGMEVHASADGWTPVYVENNLAVMSIGYLLPEENDAVVWRGPKKNGLIRQFLSDVSWNELDMLIIDTPPGTSDEHLSLVTYLKEAGIDGIVLVSTPQEASLQDVRREINFCKKVGAPIIGLIENMTDSVFDVSNGAAAKNTCTLMEVPFIGRVPMDKSLLEAGETGVSITKVNPQAHSLKDLNAVLDRVLSDLKLPRMPIPQANNLTEFGGAGVYDTKSACISISATT